MDQFCLLIFLRFLIVALISKLDLSITAADTESSPDTGAGQIINSAEGEAFPPS
jgi:hypothetical protein